MAMRKAARYALVVLFALGVFISNADSSFAANSSTNTTSSSLTEVYVNGEKGSDDNPGTKEKPVETFQKAKELVEKYGLDRAYVTGALLPFGDESWSFDGKMLVRDVDFHGELISVKQGANLTLTDIVLDGNRDAGAGGKNGSGGLGGSGGGGSLVTIVNGTATLGKGSVLQNNVYLTTDSWYPDAGGGVFLKNRYSTLNIKGATIKNNLAVRGGGVHVCEGATVNMSDGLITGNTAVDTTSKQIAADNGGYGGGVCVFDKATFNFSGGTISNNSAAEDGGGIALGTVQVTGSGSNILNMTGGAIDSNTAGGCGGGIYVQAGYDQSYSGGTDHCIANISGGDITNNKVTGTGISAQGGRNMFGGGGIYVNGYASGYGYANGVLNLQNAAIYDNTAEIYGGGYAGCPVSVTEINFTDGSAFFSNTAKKGANEIYVLASSELGGHSGDPSYLVSASMLGGGAYRWTNDDGTEVPYNMLTGTLSAKNSEELRLNNALTSSDAGVAAALAAAKVRISGNSSNTRGGGIGSNGTVNIGQPEKETTKIDVTKKWDDEGNADKRPASIEVELYRNGEYVGFQTVTPDENGDWKTTFANLPAKDADGNAYEYTVKEHSVAGYDSEVTGNAADGFTITNTPKPETTQVSVTKKWDDEGNSDKRPASIEVELYRNGEYVTAQTVTPDEQGNWSTTFADLPAKDADGNAYTYTVKERAVEGYESKVTGNAADGFTITNTYKPEEPPTPEEPKKPGKPKKELPGTGDTAMLPIALAGTAGIVLCALGVSRRVRKQ